jgi:cytochrome P450
VRRSLRPVSLGLPGPSPWDMLRGFTAIRDDPLQFLEATQARYGDLVAFPVPGSPALLVNDPVHVRHILAGNAGNWRKNTVQYAALARATGPGLLAVSDDRWLGRRRVAQPAFHHGRLSHIAESVLRAAERVSTSWAELGAGGEVEIDALAQAATLDVIGRTLFDHDLADSTEKLVAATDLAAELIVSRGRSVIPVPEWLPTRGNARLKTAVRDLDEVCRALIDDRRLRGVQEDDSDLLGLLIAAGLPDDAVRDELVTMVVAGHETVASALTWTLLLLAQHPLVQVQVRDEVRSSGGDDPAAGPVLRAVVDESLRLYPPGWVVSRRATDADTLGDQDVPSGTVAIISPWLLHRRPEQWPDPLDFRPDRFLGQSRQPARGDYLPFGLGPRLCIGRDFALVELRVIVAELLRDHAVSLPPGRVAPPINAFVTLRPRGGLTLQVTAVA